MKRFTLLAFLFCTANLAFSSHMRCGYIKVVRSNCISLQVFVTITVFTNSASDVRFGEAGIINFGDGNSEELAGYDNVPRPDLGPNVGMVIVTLPHIYTEPGKYLISYIEPNRNGGVINMSDSFNTPFYTETKVDLTTCLSSPDFLAPPIFAGMNDSELTFSLGASSPNDKLITYEMGIPFRDRGMPVANYLQPSGMDLNELTGLLSWNTESATPGEYNFAVVAFEWTKENDQYKKTGFVRIDFQVTLQDDESTAPSLLDDQELDAYNRILVTPGEEKIIEITYEPNGEGSAALKIFSELSDESVSFGFGEVEPGLLKGTLTIAPQASDVREHAYMITVRGNSNGSLDIPKSVSDKNYLIYTNEIPEFPVVIDPVTGVEEDLAQVDVFPNPFQNQVNVHVNRLGKSEVFLFTAHGVMVKTKVFESETVFTLTDLPAGVYICDIRRNNIPVKRIKLIKTDD